MIRILVAGEGALLRAGIRFTLKQEAGFEIVAEAETVSQINAVLETRPVDVVVLGIYQTHLSGLETLRSIRRATKCPVLIVSTHASDIYAVRLIKAGANGYLTRSSPPEELIRAVWRLSTGKLYIRGGVAEMLAEALAGPGSADTSQPLHDVLSDRELQVVCFIAFGKTLSEIAVTMGLSAKTISTYRARALEKLHMRTNAELTRYAIENLLVD